MQMNPDPQTELDPESEAIRSFTEMIHSSHQTVQYEGLVGLRNLMSRHNIAFVQKVIDTGIVPKLLEIIIYTDESHFQFESLLCILDICSRGMELVNYVIGLGGLDFIIYLFDSEHTGVVGNAVFAIAKIAEAGVVFRDLCLEKDCIEQIIQVLEKFSTSDGVIKSAVCAISFLTEGKPLPNWDLIAPSLPVFHGHISSVYSERTLVDSLWGISSICEERIKKVIKQGCIPVIANLFYDADNDENSKILSPILRILGYLVLKKNDEAQKVLDDPRFLPKVFEVIGNPTKQIKKEALWIINNIAAEDYPQIDIILDNDHFIDILQTVIFTEEPQVGFTAAWAICNMIRATDPQRINRIMEQYNIIDILVHIFTKLEDDVKKVALGAISKILEAGRDQYAPKIKDAGLVQIIRDLAGKFPQDTDLILAYFDQ